MFQGSPKTEGVLQKGPRGPEMRSAPLAGGHKARSKSRKSVTQRMPCGAAQSPGHRGQLRAGSARVCRDTGDSSELAPHGALAGVVNTANGTGEPGISSSVGLGTLALHSVACSEHGL